LAQPLLPCCCRPGGAQIAMLRNDSLLWTSHGLRSLSPTSSMYKQ
jgi:hypothetical protein